MAKAERRSLVLGAIRKLGLADVAPFVESLRATGYAGDIVFLVTRMDAETRRYLASRGVTMVPFRFFKPWHGPIHTARYFGFERFLKRQGAAYANVLISDVRDVVFQADPFGDRDWGGVHAFLEPSYVRYGSTYTHDLFNDRFLSAAEISLLAGRPVSCCGTVIADGTSMTALVGAMARRFRQVPLTMKHKVGPDTAFHNLLIYDGSFPAQIHANNDYVATMGIESAATYHLAEAFRIALADGTLPPICHQYDRYPDMIAAILSHFVPAGQ